MNWCKECVLPDTRPNLVIGSDGVCNACKQHKLKKSIDWKQRENSLKRVIENAKKRSTGYDCVIPVSGGKDSTWQIVKCLEMGIKILAVTWKPPGRTSIGQQNLNNLISLGVDHIDYSINPEVEAKFMLEALKKKGTTGIPMHMALFNIPTTIASKFNIPLIIWGENSAAEYGSLKEEDMGHQLTKDWVSKYGVTNGTSLKDWVSGDLDRKSLYIYEGVSEEELEQKNISAIFLGHYLKWDPDETRRVAIENGFRVADDARTGFYNFADIDDDFISVHHWLKWYKFGFTRLHDNLSLEIRNNRMRRNEAIQIIRDSGDMVPTQDIEKFCEFAGITKSIFFEICEKFRNKTIWVKRDGNWVLPNQVTETVDSE